MRIKGLTHHFHLQIFRLHGIPDWSRGVNPQLTLSSVQVDLKHLRAKGDDPVIEMGMDLSAFYLSVEWDIMAVPARRKEIFYRFVAIAFLIGHL